MRATSRARIPLLLLIPALAACGTAAVLTAGPPAGPPRPVDQVALLLDAPARPYRTVALIRSQHINLFRDVDDAKREVREAAARVGADAVILGFGTSAGGRQATSAGDDGDVVVVSDSGDRLRVYGRAIVYTGVEPPQL